MFHKFNASKQTVDGEEFDSKLEANFYKHLNERQVRFSRQVPFNILEKFVDEETGRTIRGVSYFADFVIERNGYTYVIDAKGMETQVYKLKRKLLLSRGVRVLAISSVRQLDVLIGMVDSGKTPGEIESILLSKKKKKNKIDFRFRYE
jgi:hypothetical protein